MSQSILLRGARQLLTLRGTPGVRRGPLFGNLEIIEDGSVLIQDGKIACVGLTRRLENLKEARSALQIPVQNFVVMPGFVDPGIRLSLLKPGVGGEAHPKRRKLAEFYNESITLMRSCLQHGTLNAGVKARSGIRSLGAELSLLRQLARIAASPVGLTRIWTPEFDAANMPDEKAFADTFERVIKGKLVDSLSLDKTFGQLLLDTTDRAELQVNLDWPGGTAEILESLLRNLSPVSVFCHHQLSPGERNLLAKSNSIAVFSAAGNLLDSQPDDSVRDLVEAGGAIALGSGYDAQYEPNFNMQIVLALAVRRLNLTIEQAIVATTVNAAYALHRGDQIGSLEPGKRAEVLVLNLSDYREIPRRIGVNHVAMVIRDGNLAINRTRWKVGAA